MTPANMHGYFHLDFTEALGQTKVKYLEHKDTQYVIHELYFLPALSSKQHS